MKNKSLFEQAIAEAKEIREMSIINARNSMEETITPHLKQMFTAKLREMEEEDDADVSEQEPSQDETVTEKVEDVKEDVPVVDEDDDDKDDDKDAEDLDDKDAEDDAEESEDDAKSEEEVDLEDLSMDDLKDIIRDLISQEMPAVDVTDDPSLDVDLDMGAEVPTDADAGTEDLVGMEDDDEIDLDELMAEIDGLAEEDVKDPKVAGEVTDESKEELQEAIKTINQLRKDLSEVNLLNSKLLYLNKILKASNLSESQKIQTIRTFDKAESVKEVKLIYETLTTSFNQGKDSLKETSNPIKPFIRPRKGFASAPAGKSTKIINENVANPVKDPKILRMQKLAGII